MTKSIIGRWPRPKSYLDRLITFCFDRADLAWGLADVGENPNRELDGRRGRQWAFRGNMLAKVKAGWYID